MEDNSSAIYGPPSSYFRHKVTSKGAGPGSHVSLVLAAPQGAVLNLRKGLPAISVSSRSQLVRNIRSVTDRPLHSPPQEILSGPFPGEERSLTETAHLPAEDLLE